jgi:hypothetical protein
VLAGSPGNLVAQRSLAIAHLLALTAEDHLVDAVHPTVAALDRMVQLVVAQR